MTDKEIKQQLTKIASLAEAQREGAFTTQADAMAALELINRLATLLLKVLPKSKKHRMKKRV